MPFITLFFFCHVTHSERTKVFGFKSYHRKDKKASRFHLNQSYHPKGPDGTTQISHAHSAPQPKATLAALAEHYLLAPKDHSPGKYSSHPSPPGCVSITKARHVLDPCQPFLDTFTISTSQISKRELRKAHHPFWYLLFLPTDWVNG